MLMANGCQAVIFSCTCSFAYTGPVQHVVMSSDEGANRHITAVAQTLRKPCLTAGTVVNNRSLLCNSLMHFIPSLGTREGHCKKIKQIWQKRVLQTSREVVSALHVYTLTHITMLWGIPPKTYTSTKLH